MKTILDWILLESNAPKHIRELALATYVSPAVDIADKALAIGPYTVGVKQYEEIANEVWSGRKIQAIKLLRGYASVGLKEAKDAVDSWQQANPGPSETSSESAKPAHPLNDKKMGPDKEELQVALAKSLVDFDHAVAKAKRWKQVAIYLADCHAANLDIALLKRTSKHERLRLLSIMEKCEEQLTGKRGVPHLIQSGQRGESDVVTRLREAAEEIKREFPS